MRDRIEIEKDQIPYTFDILLADEEFEIGIFYNQRADLFSVELIKNEETLCYEPIIYGVPLFQDIFQEDFPALQIVPVDESGIENEVTFKNFNETVFLTIENGDD